MTVGLERSMVDEIPIKIIIGRIFLHAAMRLLYLKAHHSLWWDARNLPNTVMSYSWNELGETKISGEINLI